MRKPSQCRARLACLLALQPTHLLSMIAGQASTKEMAPRQEEKPAKTCLNSGISKITSVLKKLNLQFRGARMLGRIWFIDSFGRVK